MFWKPIETAPKGGSVIDLWCQPLGREGYRVAGAYWNSKSKKGFYWFAPGRDWDGKDGPLERNENPTHWMRLPAPPEK